MINELITKVFASRSYTHLAHLKTRSYAQHMALGDFYVEIIDDIDKLVEAYQGTFGLLKDIELDECCIPDDITKHLSDELIWINNHCDEITKNVSSLENILQELQATYLKTLYKLKNLS